MTSAMRSNDLRPRWSLLPERRASGQSARVTDQEQRLVLDNVLDALDDLYDRRERAALNLWRLLVASGPALGGSWEPVMTAVASELLGLIRQGLTDEQINAPALVVTHDLRISLADVL